MVGESYLKDMIPDWGYKAKVIEAKLFDCILYMNNDCKLKVDFLYSIGEIYFDILWDVLYDWSNYRATRFNLKQGIFWRRNNYENDWHSK